jgi:hypothetical protein
MGTRLRTLLPWLLLVLVGAGAAWLRYALIEPHAVANLCMAAQAPAWCVLRQALVVGFLHNVYGIAAIVAAALSLLMRSRVPAWLAAALGAFALQFYNYEPGALALLTGCLRLVHLQGAGNTGAAVTPARSPESARQ